MAMWTILLLLLAVSRSCLGQDGISAFQWKFNSNSFSTSLTECNKYPIVVQSRNSTASALGTPPYYMIAFNPGGVPTTSFIGSDASNLTWTVNQKSGSSLLLTVVDAQGNYGGQPPNLFSVVDGSSSSCLPTVASGTPNITISPNFTSPVMTCTPMGLLVSGGKQPYNISLAAPNSSVLTNVTLGSTEDVLVYINRVDPGSQVMASVVDANGTWGTSTQLFDTTGSKDTDCVGLVTRTGNSSTIDLHPKPTKGHSNVAVAVIIPLIVVAILVAAGYYFWRRRSARPNKPGAAILPEAWMGPSNIPGAESMALKDNPSSSSKLAALARYRSDNPYQPLQTGESSDMVVQHRDGGSVHEIPPPYFDHGAAGPSGSNSSNNVASGSGSGPLLS